MHTQGNKSKKKQNQSQTDRAKESENLDELLNFYNLGLKDKTWLRIVRALAARGFPVKDEDLEIGER